MGDDKLSLVDVNTENPGVVAAYNSWISSLVQNYTIDGLRIDGLCLSNLIFPSLTCSVAAK